jgi:hypothetical protein
MDTLRGYCQLADWRGCLVWREASTAFYANDYLLFPAMPVHIEHDSPEVEKNYPPYFRRVVQALRTETPANASRWLGALLHFVEDNGAPPHAAQIHGILHTRMENWVDLKQIRLPGYQPRALGATEDEAAERLVRRMKELMTYSRERAERLRPLAEASRRAEMEPIALESALETSRLVADLFETLGQFAAVATPGAATLRGRIVSQAAPGAEAIPAKIVLAGTLLSTLADSSGAFEFRNLSPGDYRLLAVRPGSALGSRTVTLQAGATRVEEIALPAADLPGNLVRDPHLQLHWARPGMPDFWTRVVKDRATSWESEALPVRAGQRYRFVVRWKPGATGSAQVFWSSKGPHSFGFLPGFATDHNYGDPMNAETPVEAGESGRTLTAPEAARYALIVFGGDDSPEVRCEEVALVPGP